MQHVCYAALISLRACMQFAEELKKEQFFCYFGDNTSEIVFDKLLIEAMNERYTIYYDKR